MRPASSRASTTGAPAAATATATACASATRSSTSPSSPSPSTTSTAATCDTFTYADSETCGEHVFAPDPDRAGEDDGWLLSLVTDAATNSTDLVVLDARDIEAGPIARVRLPRRVPLGFHANWFADA